MKNLGEKSWWASGQISLVLSAIAVVGLWPFSVFYNPLNLPFCLFLPPSWPMQEYRIWLVFVPVSSILISVMIVFACMTVIDRWPLTWILLTVTAVGIALFILLGYFNWHGSVRLRQPDFMGTMWEKGKRVPIYGLAKDEGRLVTFGMSLNLVIALLIRFKIRRRKVRLQ